ncbi:GntR family transcriptional regulator [Vreelandella maris]|uniref:GntR family transcriptional regulator n=1 Tax=Vreelandella maris TaxID=2729617 RepID=A0A7Y6V9V2_9GAMM|nr:GntR family transcriptional regulator [Halomonas maris]NVF15794.1 GntR family transcriptional regulator [Halomonas maris]|tara:strand:- start:11045 stop:11731 length:687 start_codon:yes stop_codon:yes gene_type:complete
MKKPVTGSTQSSANNERGEPLSEQAYRFIIDAIKEGSLLPGTRIREVELAKRTGLSRTPVREALNRLQLEGLVANDPSRGIIITELDQSMISELYAMREVLEGTAAGLAARHASEVEIAFLREINERDAKLTDTLDLLRNNKLFHSTLYRCAHNRYLLKMLNSLQESMMLLGRSTLAKPGRPEIARKEHQEIINALEARDPKTAEQLSRTHIREAYKTRLEAFLEPYE